MDNRGWALLLVGGSVPARSPVVAPGDGQGSGVEGDPMVARGSSVVRRWGKEFTSDEWLAEFELG